MAHVAREDAATAARPLSASVVFRKLTTRLARQLRHQGAARCRRQAWQVHARAEWRLARRQPPRTRRPGERPVGQVVSGDFQPCGPHASSKKPPRLQPLSLPARPERAAAAAPPSRRLSFGGPHRGVCSRLASWRLNLASSLEAGQSLSRPSRISPACPPVPSGTQRSPVASGRLARLGRSLRSGAQARGWGYSLHQALLHEPTATATAALCAPRCTVRGMRRCGEGCARGVTVAALADRARAPAEWRAAAWCSCDSGEGEIRKTNAPHARLAGPHGSGQVPPRARKSDTAPRRDKRSGPLAIR